jgi:4-hydroxy-2-oxoheptanedioate aldolase
MPRINRAIELLAAGQPVYCASALELSYERGVVEAGTWADYLTVDLEHHPFDPAALLAFMRGLVDAGPTRSGHRTPAVIVTLPMDGSDEHAVRANAWMIKQTLAAGVHGLLLCHAETPGAARAFVEAARYPFHPAAAGLGGGRRGSGGQEPAAAIWGLSPAEYLDRADLWPLNPDGELMLGLKIENRRALANAEASAGPRPRVRRMGPGRHGHVVRPQGRSRSALSVRHGGGPRPRQSGVRPRGPRVSRDGQARQRRGAARGRDEDRRGHPGSRRDRPPSHQAHPAVVNRTTEQSKSAQAGPAAVY